MDYRERASLVSDIQEDLAGVIGASGNPEKLVKLTTNIVKGAKRLVEGVPEELSASSTATLSVFIRSAHVIAKNPRGVDSKAIQEFSTSRRAVEKTIEQLDKWHADAGRSTSPVMELDQVVEAIVKPSDQRKSSPEEPTESERGRKLTWDLQRKRDVLLLKMEPQQAPPPISDIEGALMTAVKGLMRGADAITAHTDKKMPLKEQLLEPMLLITEMVCSLLDLVDNLFVSKYPMRSQVYSFCTALIDNVLAYGCRSKVDDLTSLRSINTQTPALLNAAKVMVEQCEKRSASLEESRDLSIKRVQEIDEMVESHVDNSKNKGPVLSPTAEQQPKPEVKTEYEICCNVCTSVAVDQKTQQPISKGTELCLMVLSTTTVREVKEDLATRTGLPFKNIQFNQGQSELPDSAIINPQNPLPYFLFNKYEPTEEELLVIRKDERNKSRMKIYDLEWSQVTGPVAVALYEFDTLGDHSNLAFDEGDVIEIIEKGGDGWWEGRIGDKTGSFPASFVEEIHSRDEGVRLLELMKRGQPNNSNNDNDEDDNSRPPPRQSSETSVIPPPNLLSKLKKKGTSTPDFSSHIPSSSSLTSSTDKHRGSGLFKKKKQKGSGYSNLPVFEEDSEEGQEPLEQSKPKPPEPKFKPHKGQSRSLRAPRLLGTESPKSSPSTPTSNSPVPPPEERHPSPQMNYKRSSGVGGAPKSDGIRKRPPPPRPPPFAATHPVQAAKLEKIIQLQQNEEQEELPNAVPSPTPLEEVHRSSPTDSNPPNDQSNPIQQQQHPKDSLQKNKNTNSMEDLLNNLREFDECNAEHSYATLAEVQTEYDVDYEVISPPAAPPSPREVVTIKISDYKPDTDDELLDGEDEGLDWVIGRDEDKEEEQKVVDGLLFAEDDQWKPREWAPSPEPEPVRKPPKMKKPSFSVDVGEHKPRPPTAPKPHPQVSVTRSASLSKPNNDGHQSPDCSPHGGSPLPPPSVISRPRKSPANSPKMATKIAQNTSHEKTPPPVPPPRQKRPKQAGGMAPPSRPAPSPPTKSKGFTSSRSDMDLRGPHPHKPTSVQQRSHLEDRRWTVSQHREQLRYKLPSRSRSPVVQRKTKAVMGEESHLMSPLHEHGFTGIGKQGILLKESSTSSITDWKSRFFHLVEDGLLYFDSTESASQSRRPLGEIPLNRMVKAIPVGEKNCLQCFAILMKYETSIILGCHSKLELDDWLGSLNQLIELSRMKDMTPSYLPSVKAAEDCLEYLLNTPVSLDKTVFKLSGDFTLVKTWLQELDEGQEIDSSALCNAGTALCMLKSVLSDGKMGYLVPSEISKEISQQVKRSSPVRDIQSKLHHLPDECLNILQLFLKLFSKILEQTEIAKKHKLEVSDLNRMFGSSLFESLKSNQSLTLLAYLISTHELMF